MKVLSLIVTILAFANGVNMQHRFGKETSAQTSPVKVTLEVLRSQRAKGDADIYINNLQVRASIQNVSEDTILVYKGNPGVNHIWIASTEQAIRSGNFEVSTSYTPVFGGMNVDQVALSDFCVLARGETCSIKFDAQVLVRYRADEKLPGTLRPGKYWMQFLIHTLIGQFGTTKTDQAKLCNYWGDNWLSPEIGTGRVRCEII